MKNILYLSIFVIFLILFFLFIQSSQKTKKENKQKRLEECLTDNSSENIINPDYIYSYRGSIHLPFGFPVDNDTNDDYILEKRQYVLSYCEEKNLANWVAWQLNPSWLGKESRYSGNFISDTTLPEHFYRVTHHTYTNSGYDRGHIVRSKERTLNKEDNKATFLLTNIFPQTPDLNRGVWLRFEDYYLNMVEKENINMYIVSGGIFSDNFETLNNKGNVAIPDSCFKMVLITHHKELNNKMMINDFQTIAVVMPNSHGIRRTPWNEYLTTISAIEKSTGYEYFTLLPDSIKKAIKYVKYKNTLP